MSFSRCLTLAFAGLLVSAAVLAPAPAAAIAPGEPAPDFIAKDVATDTFFTLSDYRGRAVCLVFFWTG